MTTNVVDFITNAVFALLLAYLLLTTARISLLLLAHIVAMAGKHIGNKT